MKWIELYLSNVFLLKNKRLAVSNLDGLIRHLRLEASHWKFWDSGDNRISLLFWPGILLPNFFDVILFLNRK